MTAKKRKYIFLGYPISVDAPNPPAIPAPEITALYSLARGNEANVSVVKVANHTGTHVDAPAHVIERGLKITEFEPEEFIFNHPAVVDLCLGDGEIVESDHLLPVVDVAKNADLLLVRFGYGPVRRTQPARYSCKCPGFGKASAECLLKALPNLRAIGMDVPSLACIEHLEETMEAHNILLGGEGRRFLIIEDMNLDYDLHKLASVWVAPWLIADIDSAPSTVVGRLR